MELAVALEKVEGQGRDVFHGTLGLCLHTDEYLRKMALNSFGEQGSLTIYSHKHSSLLALCRFLFLRKGDSSQDDSVLTNAWEGDHKGCLLPKTQT